MSSERGDSDSRKVTNGSRIPGRGYIEWPTTEVSNRTPTSSVTEFEGAVFNTFNEAQRILLKKHEAYGPKNISQAPGGPENGLRVRMWDKMARLNHILENPSVDVNDESLEDTLQDLLNYCAIFIMVRRGQWPEK